MKLTAVFPSLVILVVASVPVALLVLSGCSSKSGDMHASTDPGIGSQQNLAKETAGSESDDDTESADDDALKMYDVTVENLTTGQPFSPGVIATHTKNVHLFQIGAAASEGIRLIAENGDPSVAETDLKTRAGVFDVVVINAPIHRVGGPGPNSRTFRITTADQAKRLSVATMLICTNDGFTGLDGVKLPGGYKSKVFYTNGYDAGTEANDELSTSIVDPCGSIGPVSMPPDGNNRTATNDVISHHRGILGVGNLSPSLHGWQNPVARITIQRVK